MSILVVDLLAIFKPQTTDNGSRGSGRSLLIWILYVRGEKSIGAIMHRTHKPSVMH